MPGNKAQYDVKLLSNGETVEIGMYGEIGGPAWMDDVITAKMVERTLKENPNAKQINVSIASPGGSAWEAMTIRALLQQHPARVRVDVAAVAASAATVIALSGDEIRMHEDASWMIHEAHVVTIGDKQEHQRSINRLESVNDGVAAIYAKRCNKKKEEMLELMAAETWLTAERAKEMGFVDEIIEGKGPAMHFNLAPYGYRNVPAPLMAAASKPPAAIAPAPEKTSMGISRIALALSLSDGADEAAVLSAIDKLNKESHRREHVLSELRTLTGHQSDGEMLAAVRGLQQTAATVPALQDQLKAEKTKSDKAEFDAMVAADAVDPKGRKLTPAVAKLYEGKPPAELRAYLAAASPLGVKMQSQDDSTTAAGGGSKQPPTESGEGALLHNGKPWEKLGYQERHNLRAQDEPHYLAMRKDYEQRKSA